MLDARRWFALAALGTALSAAHAAAPTQTPTFAFDVQVTDAAGRPVTDLTAKDFSVTDDRSPAPLVRFQAVSSHAPAAAPAQVIVVLDEVNTGFRYVSIARAQLLDYLRQAGPTLPVPMTIALLTDTQLLFSGSPTTDAGALATELSGANSTLRAINRAGGFYGDEDRIGMSLRGLDGLLGKEATDPGRKLIVWMSPGWPYLAFAGTTFSPKQQHGDFEAVVAVKAALAHAHATLDAVDPLGTDDVDGFQTTYYHSELKPLADWNGATTSNLGLQVLALQDGGLALNSSNDIAQEIARCVQDASAYYQISVAEAPASENGQPAFHTLAVHVDRPGVQVRTVNGYYTP